MNRAGVVASDSQHTPKYRIQAVAERTGIATATLRAWERRYGIPRPARSDARYRLYSDDDVALILQVSALCTGGMRPAEAARSARAELVNARTKSTAEPTTNAVIDAIVEAARRLDVHALRSSIERAFVHGSAAQTFDAVLSPALQRIGDLWEKEEISIANEHAAAHIIRESLTSMVRLTTPAGTAPTALLAAFDEEQHDIPLLGFALHLTTWGFRPIFLGARVPPSALGEALNQHRPTFVGIGSVLPPPLPVARRVLSAYGRVCRDIPWIVGGPGTLALADVVRRRGGIVAPASANDLRKLLLRIAREKGEL